MSDTPRLYGNKTWEQVIQGTHKAIAELCDIKGEEYKASDGDQLANFRRYVARYEGVPIEFAWAMFAGKHWDAIQTYIDDIRLGVARQRSESIESRVDDMIVFLILFKLMAAERNGT